MEQAVWLKEMVRQVGLAVDLAPAAEGRLERRAPADRWPRRGEGWFRIRGRVRPSDLDRMEDAALAAREGTDEESYGIVEAELDDGSLLVRAIVPEHVGDLFLFTRSPSDRRLRQALKDGLAAVPAGTAADAFGRQELDPLRGTSPVPAGYSAPQARALDACCAPGLHVVWGPPGTGKTHVITGAVRRLLGQGRRVLVVSSTNVAVDNAVHRIVGSMSAHDAAASPAPGAIVRVGTPHMREVAQNELVSLPRLVQARLAATQARLDELAHEITQLCADEDAAQQQLDQAEADLATFDVPAYRAAAARREAWRSVDQAERRLRDWRAAMAESGAAAASARRRTLLARYDLVRLEERA